MPETQDIQEQEELNDWPQGRPSRAVRLIGENIAQLPGLDERQVKVGYVLYLILNDDAGTFNGASLLLQSKTPERAPLQREDMARRLDWELQQEFTPRTIKSYLERAKKEITGLEWNSVENIQATRQAWMDRVFANVDTLVDNNLNGLGDAYVAYKHYEDEVHKRELPY